ncbi:hypothetical protein CLF_106330 [Clonorchis sinensis]|uniref:Uncharacterized protein n=1 Tax=Clonorchis sinensis TaxID=79923 RepID=H2KTV4_CLOSI|nr:hypothetical protein CLF_106330 [Clonorchis sinensis]
MNPRLPVTNGLNHPNSCQPSSNVSESFSATIQPAESAVHNSRLLGFGEPVVHRFDSPNLAFVTHLSNGLTNGNSTNPRVLSGVNSKVWGGNVETSAIVRPTQFDLHHTKEALPKTSNGPNEKFHGLNLNEPVNEHHSPWSLPSSTEPGTGVTLPEVIQTCVQTAHSSIPQVSPNPLSQPNPYHTSLKLPRFPMFPVDNRPVPLGLPTAFDNLFPRNIPSYLGQPQFADQFRSDWQQSDFPSMPAAQRVFSGTEVCNASPARSNALAALFSHPASEAVQTQASTECYSTAHNFQMPFGPSLTPSDSQHKMNATFSSNQGFSQVERMDPLSIGLTQSHNVKAIDTDADSTNALPCQPDVTTRGNLPQNPLFSESGYRMTQNYPYDTKPFQSFLANCPQVGFFTPSSRYAPLRPPVPGLRQPNPTIPCGFPASPFLDLRTDTKLAERHFNSSLDSTQSDQTRISNSPQTVQSTPSSNAAVAVAAIAAAAAASSYMASSGGVGGGICGDPDFGMLGLHTNNTASIDSQNADRSPSGSNTDLRDSSGTVNLSSKSSSLSPTQIWPWMTVVVAKNAILAKTRMQNSRTWLLCIFRLTKCLSDDRKAVSFLFDDSGRYNVIFVCVTCKYNTSLCVKIAVQTRLAVAGHLEVPRALSSVLQTKKRLRRLHWVALYGFHLQQVYHACCRKASCEGRSELISSKVRLKARRKPFLGIKVIPYIATCHNNAEASEPCTISRKVITILSGRVRQFCASNVVGYSCWAIGV